MDLNPRIHTGRKTLLVISALCGTAMASYGVPSLAGTTSSSTPRYDITTVAGKVASVNGTAGLQIRFSAFIEQEASIDAPNPTPNTIITPTIVLSSPVSYTNLT